MSTKNLARTVIEGGRTGNSKYLRRFGLRIHRTEENRLCYRVRMNPDAADDVLWPRRHRIWEDRTFADKTNPCDRFLASRAGRHWDDVRSEISKRFDRRSLAGRHVTYDHLIDRVERNHIRFMRLIEGEWVGWNGVRHTGPSKFWIDGKGFLRHDPTHRY